MCAARTETAPTHRHHATVLETFHPIRPHSDQEAEVTRLALMQLSQHSEKLNSTRAFYALSLAGKYTLTTIAGAGTFGVAIRATSQDGLDVVIKVSKRKDERFSQEYESCIKANELAPDYTVRAIEFMEELDLSDCGSKDRCCSDRSALVTTYGGPTLSTRYLIHPSLPIPITEFVSLARQMLNFVECLNRAGYVLRDMTLKNAVMNEQHELRFIDFGIFGQHGQEADIYEVARFFRAPTLLKEKLDRGEMFFAIACILFEIATGEPLFHTELSKINSTDPEATQIQQYKDHLYTHFNKVFSLIGGPTKRWIDQLRPEVRQYFFSEEYALDDQAIDEAILRICTATTPGEPVYRINLQGLNQDNFRTQFVHLLELLLDYETPHTLQELLGLPFFQ